MEPVKQKLYLIYNTTWTFEWDPIVDNSSVLHGVLFNAKEKYEQLKPGADDDVLYNAAEIEQALSSTTGKNCFELMGVWEKGDESFKIWTEATFDTNFVNNLREIGDKMKISVEGFICNKHKISFSCSVDLETSKIGQTGPVIVGHPSLYPNYSLKSATYSVFLEWENNIIKNCCVVLPKMLTDNMFSDCCILTVDQKEVKCHRNVLAANSDVFYSMLTSGLQESQTNQIELTDVTEDVVKNFLAYLYGMEIKMSKLTESMAFELLRLAHKYNILALEKDMELVLRKKSIASFPINTALDLYYFKLNVERLSSLCKVMMDVLRSKPKELISSTGYQQLLENNPKEAAKLAIKLMELGLSQ